VGACAHLLTVGTEVWPDCGHVACSCARTSRPPAGAFV